MKIESKNIETIPETMGITTVQDKSHKNLRLEEEKVAKIVDGAFLGLSINDEAESTFEKKVGQIMIDGVQEGSHPNPNEAGQLMSKTCETFATEEAVPAHQRETIKIAVVGNVDSGKSTLTCVLSCPAGVTDDGRGALREKVFNFGHEKENGRTTSIAHEIVGFAQDGTQVTPSKHKDVLSAKKKNTWPEIVQGSQKIAQLIDLCGHEKYLKTTMFGLSGLYPQYSMLVVGANMGVSRMTKEHIGITLALKIPMFVVVTKIDLAPDTVYSDTINTLTKILKGSFCNLKPILVKDAKNLDKISESLPSKTICPIFSVSNVSGAGIELLKQFISKLPVIDPSTQSTDEEISQTQHEDLIDTEFIIDSTYNVKNVGFVVGGTITKGEIQINSNLMIGPDKNGTFKTVIVRGI